MKKYNAFTLAETLLVVAIIGVVATLTIPNLNKNTNDAATIAAVKKDYSILAEAFDRATANYGAEFWASAGAENAQAKKIADAMVENLKIKKNCGLNDGCWTKDMGPYNDAMEAKFTMADGANVSIRVYASTYNEGEGAYEETYGFMRVDINGENKGAAVYGKDVFIFTITKSGIFPYGSPLETATSTFSDFKTLCIEGSGGCSAWVIENGNMDYLKVDSEGKCPNGKLLGYKEFGDTYVQTCE